MIDVIGIVPNIFKANVLQAAGELAAWLREQGKTVRVLQEDSEVLGLQGLSHAREDFTEGVDMILALGGDGTVLRAVDLAYERSTPLLGINLGRMGFLTAFGQSDMYEALARVFRGEFIVQQRTLLECGIHHPGWERLFHALNEIVVGRTALRRMVRLEVYINGEYFNFYLGDGLIFATATGSTAYSLSAGGPIMEPNLNCILMTPVCSHSLMARSVVLAAQDTVQIKFPPQKVNPAISIDGREEMQLEPGQIIELRTAPRALRLVKLPEYSFFGLVRQKFKFPEE